MNLEKHHYFYLFVGFLFLGIVSVNLFSDGMFLDGLLYADISRNMADGLGSFWKPHLSYGIFNEFYEHPPLALGLQSVFFRVFGDSIFVERAYSLFTFLVVGSLVVLIWERLTNDYKSAWMPLFLWVIVNSVSWAAANNMLENTMTIFVCLSVYGYLRSFDSRRFLWIVLSGLSLSLGLLTKGFFCLYIWGVPFFIWILNKKRSFWQMTIDTCVLIIVTVSPIVLLYFVHPPAQHNMSMYFNKQVLGSIQNVTTVDSRFYIIEKFFENVAVPLIIALVVIVVALKKKVSKQLLKVNLKAALVLLAIVLSGVFPIMISMKQRGFYILTVYPLFAIALAYYLYPILKTALENMRTEAKGFKIFKGVTIGIVLISIALSLMQIGRVGRDKEVIHDSKSVISVVGEGATINICPNMFTNWSLHGYFVRYGNVSLDKNQENVCQYYLSIGNCNKAYLDKHYTLVPLTLKRYKLYIRKDSQVK